MMRDVTIRMFFCQAEDGIRYLVRSRGLGDVYKRQDNTGNIIFSSDETGIFNIYLLNPETKSKTQLTNLSLIHI